MAGRRIVDEQSTPKLPRGVRLKRDDVRDQWLLLAPERVIKLDMIAHEILKRCDGKEKVASIVEGLALNFSADPAQVGADVRELLQGLVDKGMVDL